MTASVVAGFLPSRNGFHFANRWPSTPAFWFGAGLVHLGIGDVGRGLCGGMSFAVRDRFERGEAPPLDETAPPAGTPLFEELARRQVDSFDHLVVVPWRFWAMSARSSPDRLGRTIRVEWPGIRSDLDAGRLPMIGLIRTSGVNPLRLGLGHQVVGFRYEEARDGVSIGIYDPNHPDDDGIELRLERGKDGATTLRQSSGEPLLGLLHLPFVATR